MALWHDHTSVTGQKSNSGLVAEQSREGINDLSIDDSNVYIQSFHHTTGSNPFIPQSINFSISHFNFIDNMDNRTSVRSQSILPPPPLRERQVVLPTENPPTILPSQHHISHREVLTHLCTSSSLLTLVKSVHVQQHQNSISSRPLYRQSIFNSHQDSKSSTHGLFQNQNLEITSVQLPERQSPIFENSGLESPNFAEMSRPQQVRTDDHLFLQSQGQALTHSTDYVSALSTASASVVTTAPTYITARRQGLFHNNGQDSSSDSDDADSDPYSDPHPSDYDDEEEALLMSREKPY
jgi:hypothetical protein